MQRLPLPTGFTVVAVIWIGGRIVLRTGSLDALTIGLDVVFGIAVAAAVTAGIGVQRR